LTFVASTDAFTAAEISELARIFTAPLAATHLLRAVGFPAERIPDWRAASALEFWTEVSWLFAAGIMHDGRRRVLERAHVLYPANALFAHPADAVPTAAAPAVPVPVGAAPAPRVFLSCAEDDIRRVRAVATFLSRTGFEPSLGPDLFSGPGPSEAVRTAIWSCASFVACVSGPALERQGRLHREISLARERDQEMPGDTFILMVLLRPCELPASLDRYQRVDLFAADGSAQLSRALGV
jgi:hypothetical protein